LAVKDHRHTACKEKSVFAKKRGGSWGSVGKGGEMEEHKQKKGERRGKLLIHMADAKTPRKEKGGGGVEEKRAFVSLRGGHEERKRKVDERSAGKLSSPGSQPFGSQMIFPFREHTKWCDTNKENKASRPCQLKRHFVEESYGEFK